MSKRSENEGPGEVSETESVRSGKSGRSGRTAKSRRSVISSIANKSKYEASDDGKEPETYADELMSIDDDLLAEKIHIYAPRKRGIDIAPGIERLVNPTKVQAKDLKHHQKYFQTWMQRSRLKDIDKHLTYLSHFDQSDTIVPHGEISKRIYQNILNLRNFDAYARPLLLSEAEIKKYEENLRRYLIGKKYRYTRPPDESEKIRKEAIPVFDHDLPIKKQPLTTAPWKVGVKDVYNPPVGFAKTPGNVLRSEGREGYYSYNGEWKDGMMHGEGEYLFSDGYTYKGSFKDNNCDGLGVAEYHIGSSYEGRWKDGKFHGEGTLRSTCEIKYEGTWRNGKREGKGILTLPCGLVYEGEFKDGVPHGRGRMESKLTGYVYDGSWEKYDLSIIFYNIRRGSIEGSGTLITPPPESKRIVRYWPHAPGGMTLSGAIRYDSFSIMKYHLPDDRLIIQERKDFYATNAKNKEIMFAPKRKLFLSDYVQKVRTELHEQRAIEKRERLNNQMKA